MTLEKGFFFGVNNLPSKGATTTSKIGKQKRRHGGKSIMENMIQKHVKIKSNNPNFD